MGRIRKKIFESVAAGNSKDSVMVSEEPNDKNSTWGH